MIRLYDNIESGNCYKIRLLLTQREIPFEKIDVAVFGDREADRVDTVRKKSPTGKIPTIVLEDGRCLSESTAILWYFAEGTSFLPDDALERARVLQWLAWEQNSHEPCIAVARHVMHTPGANPPEEQIAAWQAAGNKALGVMESHLADHDWFAADRYTIADIGLFAYTHVADEGCFDLNDFPAIQAWIARVQEQPRFIPLR